MMTALTIVTIMLSLKTNAATFIMNALTIITKALTLVSIVALVY